MPNKTSIRQLIELQNVCARATILHAYWPTKTGTYHPRLSLVRDNNLATVQAGGAYMKNNSKFK